MKIDVAARRSHPRTEALDAPLGYYDGTNLYEFVHADPATLDDPSGLAPMTQPIPRIAPKPGFKVAPDQPSPAPTTQPSSQPGTQPSSQPSGPASVPVLPPTANAPDSGTLLGGQKSGTSSPTTAGKPTTCPSPTLTGHIGDPPPDPIDWSSPFQDLPVPPPPFPFNQ
jgi:hypothetical protein